MPSLIVRTPSRKRFSILQPENFDRLQPLFPNCFYKPENNVVRIPPPLEISEEDRRTLETWVRGRNTPQKIALRARICLLAEQGKSNTFIAQDLHVSRPTVILWRKRFHSLGPRGLAEDAPRRPSPRKVSSDLIQAILERTQTLIPGQKRWTTRSMAKEFNISPSTVFRIWRAYGVKPGNGSGFSHKRATTLTVQPGFEQRFDRQVENVTDEENRP